MTHPLLAHLDADTEALKDQGLFKEERVIHGRQHAVIEVGGRDVINLCANNYLGLASHPEVLAAAHRALDEHGYGMASVRFICGTQDVPLGKARIRTQMSAAHDRVHLDRALAAFEQAGKELGVL